MGTKQHDEAKRLLPILFEVRRNGETLTYATAAARLGRPARDNARMAAQVCDLLDAAAGLAGVPLLALTTVLLSSHKLNHKAFKGHPLREAIIERSRNHHFRERDLFAIQEALDQLEGIGNVAAWNWLHARVTRERLDQSLAGFISLADFDAVNDLGTDIPRSTIVTSRGFLRDPRIRKAVLKRAGGKCELCGKAGFLCSDGSRYLEAHHIIALADDGPDRMSNVIALCADDHREAHLGRERSALEERMILIVREVETSC
jgi:hypothetical protein